MHSTSRSPDKLPYRSEHFVNREQALKLVLDKARRIANGELEKRRVIRFLDRRGAGKTWVLRRLEELAPGVKIKPCYQEMNATFDVQAFRRAMAHLPRPLLLLLDIDGAGEVVLDELGDRVLGRLVLDTRVLMVLAERGAGHYWAIPGFSDAIEEMILEPFKRWDIEELVRLQVPDCRADLDEVERLGRGFPWSTYLLASTPLDERSPVVRCIDALLEGINGGLRERFAALSVLRTFNDDRVAPLLKAYSQEFRDQEWNYLACHALCLELVSSTLAQWDSGRSGYVIDEPLRLVLEADLRARTPALWQDLHEAAYLMYAQLFRADPNIPMWAAELVYHGQRLDEAGRPRPQPAPPETEEGGGNGR